MPVTAPDILNHLFLTSVTQFLPLRMYPSNLSAILSINTNEIEINYFLCRNRMFLEEKLYK